MIKVAVLGSKGMLGSTVTRVLIEDGFEVLELNRRGSSSFPKSKAIKFVVDEFTTSKDLEVLQSCDVVINAIGLIKQVIDEDNEEHVLQAHLVNSYFPMLLDDYSRKFDIPVIQIGTDCVFSGQEGRYSEISQQRYTDLYSFTKSVGEQLSLATNVLRTSVIGCEKATHFSLLSWVLSQKQNAEIHGFNDHHWNGLTSFHFAKIAVGVIRSKNYKSGIRHVVPADTVTKETLVREIALNFGRSDIKVMSTTSLKSIDRTLTTVDTEENSRMWNDAGYESPLTILEMIESYGAWERNS